VKHLWSNVPCISMPNLFYPAEHKNIAHSVREIIIWSDHKHNSFSATELLQRCWTSIINPLNQIKDVFVQTNLFHHWLYNTMDWHAPVSHRLKHKVRKVISRNPFVRGIQGWCDMTIHFQKIKNGNLNNLEDIYVRCMQPYYFTRFLLHFYIGQGFSQVD